MIKSWFLADSLCVKRTVGEGKKDKSDIADVGEVANISSEGQNNLWSSFESLSPFAKQCLDIPVSAN